jgi:hypothetical protein
VFEDSTARRTSGLALGIADGLLLDLDLLLHVNDRLQAFGGKWMREVSKGLIVMRFACRRTFFSFSGSCTICERSFCPSCFRFMILNMLF